MSNDDVNLDILGPTSKIVSAYVSNTEVAINELPQLINVLRGDMSFVGPRPETPRYVEMFRNDYEELLTVRPGITDLSSIKYRHESEILGQVKDAYDFGREAGTVGRVLDRLLRKTFSVAKSVRTETDIARSAVSISYAAVELARKIFGETEGRTAMIIGAGEMAELALRHLVNTGVKEILVANRTFEKAVDLAKGKALLEASGGVTLENVRSIAETGVDLISVGALTHSAGAKDVSCHTCNLHSF